MDKILKKDSLFIGMLIGGISVILLYVSLVNFDKWWINSLEKKGFLPGYSIPLIVIAINMLLFRFLMINRKRYNTGSGVLLIVFVSAIFYFLNAKYSLIEGK